MNQNNSYLGSKAASGAYQAIIGLMPPHHTYIETHLGSGAVMAAKPAARLNIGIDIDPEAIEFAQANRLVTYNYPLELHSQCAHKFLKTYNFKGDELVYCDPPYLHSTRSSNNKYRYEYSFEKHIELLKILKSIDSKVIISGYPSKLYDEFLSEWNSKEFQVMTRGGVRTEKVWFNYEQNSSFWSSFAGENYTQRQQIKRKAQRWASNFKNMPFKERTAVLAAMLEVSSDV